VIEALTHAPAWFQSDTCLAVLGFWAALELLSQRQPELRQLLLQVDGFVKAAVSMLVAFAVIDGETAHALSAIQQAGVAPESGWALAVGGATFAAAGLRRSVVELVSEADEGDALGFQSVLAWAETTWTVVGLVFLVVFPLVALALAGLTLLGIWLVRRRAEQREERSRVPCAGCGIPLLPHATACHACGHALAAPRAVGVFGQPRATPADPARQAFDLAARKRCPLCASRLPRRAVRQPCPTCGKVTFAGEAEVERYLQALTRRLPRTLVVCTLLGAVPLVGLVPGVVYYRLNLVSGLRAYLPPLRSFVTRNLVRLLHVVVVVLQPIPLVGAAVLPVLCLVTFLVYRRSLRGTARAELGAPALTAGA